MLKQRGAYLFDYDRSRMVWVDANYRGLSNSGCTFYRKQHKFIDAHGNELYLFVPCDRDRIRGVIFDKAEVMAPIHSEEMFIAWETLKTMVRPHPPVVGCGQEGHTNGQGLDRQRDQAPGGAPCATRSTPGTDDTQVKAESGDRRGGRAAGTEAGEPRAHTGRVRKEVGSCNFPNCDCEPREMCPKVERGA